MKIIGHRGARGLAPENTLAAIQKGIDHNCDMIEIDLRVTSDNIAVLHHDPKVKMPDGKKLSIRKNTYANLKAKKPDLAEFREVLEEFGHKTELYIEIKPRVNTQPIIKALKLYLRAGGNPENISLGSKSHRVLLELHEALPDLKKIVIEPWSGVRAHLRARRVGAKTISMNRLWLWSFFIRSVSRSGFELYTYNLNDPNKAGKWAKYGLKGVVTDFPDRFEKSSR